MLTILAVDDSRSVRDMVAFTLRNAGFEVIEAADGADALNRAKRVNVNLVLTDINMPNLDGIALIKELRKLPGYRFTPILTLTTESSPEMKVEGKLAGATGWMLKPFHPDQLIATIRRVIA